MNVGNHNFSGNKYYTAIQGGYGRDPSAEERARESSAAHDKNQKLIRAVASITGLSDQIDCSLTLPMFNVSVTGDTLRAGKSPAQAVVSSLLFISTLNVPEAESKALLAACAWVYREGQHHNNQSDYVDSFRREAQSRVDGTALSPAETELLKKFIQALTFIDSELTWRESFLFNPNPHPNRMP